MNAVKVFNPLSADEHPTRFVVVHAIYFFGALSIADELGVIFGLVHQLEPVAMFTGKLVGGLIWGLWMLRDARRTNQRAM